MRRALIMSRLTKVEDGAQRLVPGDACWHIGEFLSHGGYGASETNQQIKNLKIEVPVPAHRRRWKDAAVSYWAEKLGQALKHDFIRDSVTFVPAPCSKPKNHAEYDDRLVRVLRKLEHAVGTLDIREVVIAHADRPSQSKAEVRATVTELLATIRIDPATLVTPLRPVVLIVDDVFTLGTTFRAMKILLETIPGDRQIGGVFLARTIWPTPDFGFQDETL